MGNRWTAKAAKERQFERKCRQWALMERRVEAAWAGAPRCAITVLLWRQLIGRYWDLLERGQAEAADRLGELLPVKTKLALLDYFFDTQERYPGAMLNLPATDSMTGYDAGVSDAAQAAADAPAHIRANGAALQRWIMARTGVR